LKHAPAYYEITDWTDGCIALSTADMVEVWLLTRITRRSTIPSIARAAVGYVSQAPVLRTGPHNHSGNPFRDSSIVVPEFIDARVGPRGSLENLSQPRLAKLLDSGQGGLYRLFRQCALGGLNSGAGADNDNARNLRPLFGFRYRDRAACPGASSSSATTPPASAFVDGQMIAASRSICSRCLRDVVFISNEIIDSGRFDLRNSAAITNAYSTWCVTPAPRP